jgi:hypothetical protein
MQKRSEQMAFEHVNYQSVERIVISNVFRDAGSPQYSNETI